MSMSTAAVAPCPQSAASVRVALLTNLIPPHMRDVLIDLAGRVGQLTVLLSTPMEEGQEWQRQWGDLDVRLQRTVTLRQPRRHPGGFPDMLSLHIPWNTLGLLRGLRPEAIVSSELGFRSLCCALYRLTHPGVRLLLSLGLSEHTELGRGLLRTVLRRWLVRRADAVLVNGASGQRYLEKLGCPARRIFRVPYAPAPESLYHGPVARDPAVAHKLLYAGRLIELKGIVPFMEALIRWATAHRERRVEFSIVGSGPIREPLERLSRPENLALEFLGERRPDEMAQIYARFGIFVLPTLSDEWGLVVNEAMAAGMPVLGSLYSQAVEEMCVEGQTGWLFHPDSPGEIEQAIDRAMNTPVEAIEAMRPAARQRVASITAEYAAECTAQAIRAALHRRGS